MSFPKDVPIFDEKGPPPKPPETPEERLKEIDRLLTAFERPGVTSVDAWNITWTRGDLVASRAVVEAQMKAAVPIHPVETPEDLERLEAMRLKAARLHAGFPCPSTEKQFSAIEAAIEESVQQGPREFLDILGPRVLVALWPEGGKKPRFKCSADADAVDWIGRAEAAGWNVYAHVNATREGFSGKASKGDILEVSWLHVDIDDLPLEKLQASEPTMIVFSGGGFHGWKKLEEPCSVEDGEAASLAWARSLGGDHCHDATRILRIPGTTNFPDAKKRARGRVPTPTRLVEYHPERIFRIGDLPKDEADEKPIAPVGNFETDERVKDMPEKWKLVVREGRNLADASEFTKEDGMTPDRSKAVYFVVCESIRRRLPVGVAKAILLDRRYRVSDHVYDQANPGEYVDKQFEHAAAAGVAPESMLPCDPTGMATAMRDALWPNLKRYQGDFLDWRDGAYRALDDDTVRAETWKLAAKSKVLQLSKDRKSKQAVDFVPTVKSMASVSRALEAISHVPSERLQPPCWIGGASGPPTDEILASPGGLLHVPTGAVLPATPDFFTRNAIDYAYDPRAAPPALWLRTLAEVFPGDQESTDALQEIMGYLLLPDNSLQKMFLIVGPPRSGKGTIGRVIWEGNGSRNCGAPTLDSLGKDFGMNSLIGKQLSLVSDMRVGRLTDSGAIAQNLLRITGGDPIDIQRKFKDDVTATLKTRFMVLSNEVPRWGDRTGTIVSRIVALKIDVSFLGREDPLLFEKLRPELPGILLWRLEGWKRLRARGHFVQPTRGLPLIESMLKMTSKIRAFVEECCEVGSDFWVEKDLLFERFKIWHLEQFAQGCTSGKNSFLEEMYSHHAGFRPSKPRADDGKQVPVVAGLKLKPTQYDALGPTH